jgi:hypothetical protein
MVFQNYADVQAALNREYEAWRKGEVPVQQSTGLAQTSEGTEARQWWSNQVSSAPAPNPPHYTPPPPAPTPPSPWITTQSYTAPTGIKQADPDIVLGPATDTSGDFIVERFFEQLGGTELINLSRHDLIDGIKVEYNPIANLSELRKRFNPNNIIAIDYLSLNEFARPSIDLLSRGPQEPYFDEEGNLVVEIDIIRSQENIEVEISERGTVNRIEL